MDRFEALSTFVAVAEQGGFAKAARHLRTSPPAVTRAVAALERHLGVPLFQRSTRSVVLTGEGAKLLDQAREILARLQEAEHEAMGGQTVPRGELHVTAPTVFGRLHVLPVVVALLRSHPEVKAHLMLVDRNIRLVEEGLDVAVRIGALDDSALVAAAIGSVRQVLVASPDYCARRGRPRQPAELTGHDIVHGDTGRVGVHWRFGARGDRVVTVIPRVRVNSVDATLAAAAAGLGIANVLSYQAAEGLASGALRTVLEAHAPPPIPIHLLFHSSRSRVPAVRRFVDMMRERARENAWN